MASILASKENPEENIGPSVDSDNPEERISARRERIRRRLEEARRAALGELVVEKKEEIIIRPSDTQINMSKQRLAKLTSDGNEIISNIRIAADARESSRRVEEDELKRQRVDKIESERKSCSDKMAEITRKWESALQKEIPDDLRKMLMQQQTSTTSLIDEKNKLISDFKAELTNCDLIYSRDLKRWAQDIDLLVERMETQFRTAALTYRQELLTIERAFDAERTDLLKNHNEEWMSTVNKKRDTEEEFLKQRGKLVDEFEEQLDIMRRKDAEDYNIIKAKLENDVQLLEQQLQMMKATYQLNQEKLEYNMQVLKKREEENVVTINIQKRKLTKLHDTLNRLQQKLEKQETSFQDENDTLSKDYKRISDLLQQLMHKASQLVQADNEKFKEVWLMNEDECKKLANRLLDISKIIFEQQLGTTFEQKELGLMAALESRPDSLSKQQRSASEMVRSVMEDAIDASNRLVSTEEAAGKVILRVDGSNGFEQVEITSSTIKRILELLCDESGFLIEDKLQRLLAPLDKDDRNLIKLDAIFHALRIDNDEDVAMLAKYFLEIRKTAPPTSEGLGEDVEGEGLLSLIGESERRTPEASSQVEGDGDEQPTIDDQLQGSGEETEESIDLIHPNGTLFALRSFIDEFQRFRAATTAAATGKPIGEFRLSLSEHRGRDKAKDTEFWKQFSQFPAPKDEKIWDALTSAMEKYHGHLESRSKLLRETDTMRQQNNELRLLLHQYLQAKVNQDLMVPPTKVMQLEAATSPPPPVVSSMIKSQGTTALAGALIGNAQTGNFLN